jgi:monovalent cation:H+ antiporter, CPA1 family
LPFEWLHVVFWSGLRGAVSTALALSLPVGFPHRTELQGITFGVVLFTLLVQATTADLVVGRWGRKTKAAPEAKAPVGSKGPIGKTPHDGLTVDGARGGPAGDGAASPAEPGSAA